MRIPRLKLVGIALCALLGIIIFASLLAAHESLPPALNAIVLIAGFALNLALHGGNIHDAGDTDTTVFLNIAVWSLLLGVAAIVCLRAESEPRA